MYVCSVCLHLCHMLLIQLAEQLYQTMSKRFKDTPHVWTQYGLFLMKQGRPDAARKVLEKSLKAVHMKQRAYMQGV